MPSVVDLVAPRALKKVALEAGVVVPIDHHVSIVRGLWPLGHGGSLYLVTEAEGRLWLVAVLEAPEQGAIMRGDTRKPGWYAAPNTVPITDITELRELLKLNKFPSKLTPAREDALRELLDEVDVPVMEVRRDSAPAIVAEGPPLVRAVAYLAASAVGPAIGALLEAWRESRAVVLADLIDRASRCLPGIDHPRFVDRGADTSIEALAELPDDPRIARWLVENIGGYQEHALPLIERSRDATSWAALVACSEEVILHFYDEDDEYMVPEEVSLVDSGLAKFAWKKPRTTALTAADRTQVATIEHHLERLEAPQRTERELIDAIAEHPDDDEPRLVYADWLIERGHPRGELLALTLQSPSRLTSAQRRRLAILGEVPVFGALDELATMRGRKRDRGLDDRLDIYWSTPVLKWQRTAHDPLIRLLREIRLVGDPKPRAEGIAAFLRAAIRVQRVLEIEREQAEPVLALLDGEFEYKRDALVRVKAKPARRR
jgi:uncharacterized protein (TIGR02996 family)